METELKPVLYIFEGDRKTSPEERRKLAARRNRKVRCADCGQDGQNTGHQDCQYPQDH